MVPFGKVIINTAPPELKIKRTLILKQRKNDLFYSKKFISIKRLRIFIVCCLKGYLCPPLFTNS